MESAEFDNEEWRDVIPPYTEDREDIVVLFSYSDYEGAKVNIGGKESRPTAGVGWNCAM